VITANTFPSNRLALAPGGFGDRVAEINHRAVQTAIQARENAAERPVLVAGSLSPHSAEGIPDPTPDPDTGAARAPRPDGYAL
jgi:methionine synthase I (cobalamin-dependent)